MWTNQLSGIYFSDPRGRDPRRFLVEPETVLTGQRNDDALSLVPYPLADGWHRRGGRGRHLPRPVARSGHAAGHARCGWNMGHDARRASSAIVSRDRSSSSIRHEDHHHGCDIARQRRGDLLQAIAARPDPLRHGRGRPAHREPDRHHHRRRDIEQGSALARGGTARPGQRPDERAVSPRRRRPGWRSAGREPGRP